MNYTQNYNLNLPSYSDGADVSALNENFTEIDTKLKENADAIKNVKVPTDQTYQPTSANPQSGVAVAQAIKPIEDGVNSMIDRIDGDFVEINIGATWNSGGIASANGQNLTNTKRIRTDYIAYNENSDVVVKAGTGSKVIAYLYAEDKTYIPIGDSGFKSKISLSDYADLGGSYFRLVARPDPDGYITTQEEQDAVANLITFERQSGGLSADVKELKTTIQDKADKSYVDELKADVENKVNQTYVDEKLESITGGAIEGLYPIVDVDDWTVGTISSTTDTNKGIEAGGDGSNPFRARTKGYLEYDESIVITATSDRRFVLYFYSTENDSTTSGIKGYLGKTDWLTGTVNLIDYIIENTKYFRVIGQYNDERLTENNLDIISDYIVIKKYQEDFDVTLKDLKEKTDDLTQRVADLESGIPVGDAIEDKPQTMGVLNALLRAKQFANVEYTTTNDLPNQTEQDWSTGTEIKGIVYSSTRVDDKMVGINVSLHTFMTAIANPKSVIYTKFSSSPTNAKTYYGTVCSSFVAFAYGIPYNITTSQMPIWNGCVEVGLYNIQLGDFMVTATPNGHCILITGIKRDRYGRIVEVTTTESMTPTVKTITYTFENFVDKYVKDVNNKGYNYRFFHYNMVGDAQYVPSQYVAIEEIGETPTEIVYPDIITDYGDKATVLAGTDITANVITSTDYTSIEVYKDDTLLSTHSVEDVTISSAEAGHYEFRMIGTDKTSSTYILVVDYNASKNGNTISFNSANSEPLCVSLVGTDYGNRYIIPVKSSDTSVEINIDDYPEEFIYMKVYFKNEYGSVAVKVDL